MTSARLTERFSPPFLCNSVLKQFLSRNQSNEECGVFFSGSLLIPVGEKNCQVIMSAHLIFISWDSSTKEKIHATIFKKYGA